MEKENLRFVFYGMIIFTVANQARSQLLPPVPPVPPIPPMPPAVPQPMAPPVAPLVPPPVPPPVPQAIPPVPAPQAPPVAPPVPQFPPSSSWYLPNGKPRYEVDKDAYYYNPAKESKSKYGGKQNMTGPQPQITYRYEFDLIEPEPPTTPRPIYFPKHRYVSSPRANYITRAAAPQPQRTVYPQPSYRANLVNPYKQQILLLKQQLLRARQLAAVRPQATPLYSPYPIRDFLRIATANGIKCYTLYTVYGIKPRISYASICGQKASCPYPYVKPVQVGQICVCCSNFNTLGSYVTVMRPGTASNQGRNSGD